MARKRLSKKAKEVVKKIIGKPDLSQRGRVDNRKRDVPFKQPPSPKEFSAREANRKSAADVKGVPFEKIPVKEPKTTAKEENIKRA